MLLGLTATAALTYGIGTWAGRRNPNLSTTLYPAPAEGVREIEILAAIAPFDCSLERIGRSTEGRSIAALRLRGPGGPSGDRPRLLVTGQIHAVEFVAGVVARGIARKLVLGYGQDDSVTRLLDTAEIWIVPLLNPDGAARVWRRGGWGSIGESRFTANGVDPNRNFPFQQVDGRARWNTGSDRTRSAYFRGPHPLSEPECLALARLCAQQRFCAALNFHSFGGVVFLPRRLSTASPRAQRAAAVFSGTFQAHQTRLRYRPVPEDAARIVGQLDPFLLGAFGTPSFTIEVSRPGPHIVDPRRTLNVFWWANPLQPQVWVDNDVDASIAAMLALLDATDGAPLEVESPELADTALASQPAPLAL